MIKLSESSDWVSVEVSIKHDSEFDFWNYTNEDLRDTIMDYTHRILSRFCYHKSINKASFNIKMSDYDTLSSIKALLESVPFIYRVRILSEI